MLNGIQQSLIASNTCGTKSRNLPADHTHVGLLIGTPMINNDDSDDDDDDDDHDHDDDDDDDDDDHDDDDDDDDDDGLCW